MEQRLGLKLKEGLGIWGQRKKGLAYLGAVGSFDVLTFWLKSS